MILYRSYNSTFYRASSNRNSTVCDFADDDAYRDFVARSLRKRIGHKNVQDWIKTNLEKLLPIYCLDFGPVRERLRELYSKKPRNKPYAPEVILRSLLLMLAFGVTSITKWAKRVKSEPLLAIFCGIEPGKAPAVGTYYEFLKRLENGPFQPKCQHRVLASEQRSARRRNCVRSPRRRPVDRLAENEHEHGQVMNHFVDEVISQESQPVPNDLESRLNAILIDLVVRPSAELGLINLLHLRIAGDGSVLESDSNPDGKRTCDCRSQGIFNCDHPRRYSDPDSAWGWDNRRKDYVYGYRFFQAVSLDVGHNLPIYVNIGPANTFEPKMAVSALDRMEKLGLDVKQASFDALYDLYAFYGYLDHKGIEYAIPYKKTPPRCIALGDDGLLFDSQGHPLCPGGKPMLRHGLNKQGKHVYHCPIKRSTHRQGRLVRVVHFDECPRGSLCEPDSKMGPIVYVSDDIDLRIHPKIARGSSKYKDLNKARSTCERSNSMKKETYLLKYTKTRVISYALIRLVLISILEHTKVWVKRMFADVDLKQIDVATLFG